MSSEDRILDIRNLSVEYITDEARIFAVNDLSFSMNSGETVGLVGETGAGKTTTALSIMRLLPDRIAKVTGGSIILNGKDVFKLTKAELRAMRGVDVSMIFQDPMSSLNPVLTIGDQICEVIRLHNPEMNDKQINARCDELLNMIGIVPARKSEYPHQFSGGMKQRVIIAIALACEPGLLLADEPTTALDVTIQAQVLELMNELKKKMGTSMLLITHDLGVVAETCDKVAVMYAGEIIESGTAEDIFGKENNHPYTTGLFGSIPSLDEKSRRLKPINGLMPDPSNLPTGCKFHDRCPECMEICKIKAPETVCLGTHMVKCHLLAQKKGEE